MSGQGGIAVLVSGIQLILAALGTLKGSGQGEEGKPSVMIGILLWILAGLGGIGCRIALRYISGREEYGVMLGKRDDGVRADKGVTGVILRKNIRLELAVAWVFTVTLVCPRR
jgi:equilibrative nucleoside transporter 1/2/3